MKLLTSALYLSAFILAPYAANASEVSNNDGKVIVDALAAFDARKFELVVEKTDLVIQRFEAGKGADSSYVCASSGADTLAALAIAAMGRQPKDSKSNSTKSKTVAISQDICTAYFLKGFALLDLEQREKALPNLETAVVLDPDNQQYLNELAEWYKVERQWQKSLDLFTTASVTTDLSVELMADKDESKRTFNNNRCRSFRGIAFNYAELKRWADARRALKKCLAIIPDDQISKSELEYIEANSGS
jgi:tetratricopeptide (TPR) repeat protein